MAGHRFLLIRTDQGERAWTIQASTREELFEHLQKYIPNRSLEVLASGSVFCGPKKIAKLDPIGELAAHKLKEWSDGTGTQEFPTGPRGGKK